MTKISFGTDGWRAIMDQEFTTENVERLSQAFALYMLQNFKPTTDKSVPQIVVGYDFRKNSENYANTVCSVLLANGLNVILSDQALPTPGVSRAILNSKSDAGIMVTASHNPGAYNGIKIKDHFGSSADQVVTKGVEALLDKEPAKHSSEEAVSHCLRNILTPYLEAMKTYLRMDLFEMLTFRIAVDSMHGSGGELMAELLRGTSIDLTTLHGKRDVTFGGVPPEPILKNLNQLVKLNSKKPFDAAFATDGDSDRIGAIRADGSFVTPGQLLSLILIHMVEDLGRKGDVVTTLSNTALIFKVAGRLGLKAFETPVGFKYLVEVMREKDVLISGEESGGLAFQGYMQERDGILSALLILQMMAVRGKSLEQLLKDMEEQYGTYSYSRIDQHIEEDLKTAFLDKAKNLKPETIDGVAVVDTNVSDGIKFILENGAWLLFRMSGTEPLLRIYAESQASGQDQKLLEWGKELAASVKA